MTDNPQRQVFVEVANLSQESPGSDRPEVLSALAGFAYLAAASIEAGHQGLLTTHTETQLSGYENLIDGFNEVFSNDVLWSAITARHPAMNDVAVKIAQAIKTEAYDRYIQRLGVMDTLYSLVPDPERREDHYLLTIRGFD